MMTHRDYDDEYLTLTGPVIYGEIKSYIKYGAYDIRIQNISCKLKSSCAQLGAEN